MVDHLTPERRSSNMRRIRSRDTAPEMVVRRAVHGMGFRYRLHVRDLPGKPDLVFPRLRSVIQVQGCFWHQHPNCVDCHIPKTGAAYWKPKLDRNCERDKATQAALKKAGWRVLIVWECETRNPAKLGRKLAGFLSR